MGVIHFHNIIRFMRLCIAALTILSPYFSLAQQQSTDNLIRDLRWRNIGNANLIGRISAIDALDDDFAYVIVGAASGGVWKSVNAGNTWEPIFNTYSSASIGDVRIFQKDRNIIWVGTGEECARNSAAWGDGVYKSTDGGRTFQNMGLKDTYTIGSIVLHPTDPNIAYAAAAGCIWGDKVGDRGFFKTIDGGKTWTKLAGGLPNDGVTGAIEAVMDPKNPNTLYVAFWERHRTSYVLNSGGPNGGIFKTTDGGKTFKKLTNGLPTGKTGKIGLAVAPSNPKIVMAHIEAEYQPAQNDPNYNDLTKLGSGIYRSEDGGESWKLMNRYFSRPFYYQHIAVSPFDDKFIYSYTINFQVSEDGGKTLRGANGGGHCWHALWLDPHNRDRFYVGSDGGAVLTHDRGVNYITFYNINVTQYYTVDFDMRDPYYVYGGLQDAGSSGGPAMTRANAIYTSDWFNLSGGDGYHVQVDKSDWKTVYSESQPSNNGGNVGRMNVETRERTSIRPVKGRNILNYEEYITPEIERLQLEKGWGSWESGGMGAFRYNWSTPYILSPHDNATVLLGANHLLESHDKGTTWKIISPDLSKNEYQKTIKASGGLTPDEGPGGGAEFAGTIITLSESPIRKGIIWAGTDDGNIQVTQNDGKSWSEVSRNISGLPAPDLWISEVEASRFSEGTAYVTVDGHRSGLFKPWVFKTTDFGRTWSNITGNIPDGQPVYCIKEDLKNPNLLFVGTEFAIYYTLNGGRSWAKLNNNLPTVAIFDIKIHPRDNDLIIATHGRGIWIMDDISALQQATPEVLASEASLFQNKTATQWLTINPQGIGGSISFRGENPQKGVAIIGYYLSQSAQGQVNFEISDIGGTLKRNLSLQAQPGIGKLAWNMRFDPPASQMITQIQNQLTQISGRQDLTQAQQQQLQQFRNLLSQAGNDTQQLTTLQQNITQAFGGGGRGGGGRGGGRGGGGGAQGPLAEPGTYTVKMTVNGKSYFSSVTIRPDPMLNPGGSNN